MDDYKKFLKRKKRGIKRSKINVKESDINNILYPFQRHIVMKALKAGKYAIFADCGLGKTYMQTEWARVIHQKTNKPVFILCPLAVAGQTVNEALKLNITINRFNKEVPVLNGIYIANYEQVKDIDSSILGGVVLDESSIIKNFDGKMRTLIIDRFEQTPFKLACTATPSPNDPMELGNHAEFLNVMTRSEVLAMYFVHDGGQTSKWRIKGHAQSEFWSFVSSWATMISKPSDLGFCQDGYDLPELNMFERQIVTPKKENGLLFNETAVSATNFNKELRLTKVERIDEVAKIVNSSSEKFIIWIKHNDEGQLLRSLIPDAVEVKGSDKPHLKESRLLGFANNEFRVLITKTKIAQFGLNYQNCHNQVFASLDFSFEGLYQAIRRSYRFGQKKSVNVYLITTDTMANVISSIKRKEDQFQAMKLKMNKQINMKNKKVSDKLNDLNIDGNLLMFGDCVQRIKDVRSNSIGLSVFSPPFAELYTYSDKLEDMGNSKDYNEFLTAFSFLVKELYRVMMSGRNVAVHCMDLPIQKGKEGFIGLRDFSGMILEAFQKVGFIYHSRVTIWKDPVIEMQRTKALGLLHKQVKKDSTMSRVGIPDYIMIFRKDGERNNPVTNTDLPVDLWQKYASPVWYDINYSKTLNFTEARSDKDEKHICPLQLETIERLVHLYSNKGDTILTPFAGVGSELYQAIKMDRNAIGIELKDSYFQVACKNVKNAIKGKNQLQLF